MGLVLDRQQDDRFFPNLTFTHNRTIDLPPGTSVGIMLVSGAEYDISGEEGGLPPYCVFGRGAAFGNPTATLRQSDHDLTPPQLLAEPLRLAVQDGALALRPWDISLPYRKDEQGLRALREVCFSALGSGPLIVRTDGDRVSIRLGRCSLATALPPDPENRPAVMALMAAAQWDSVKRADGGFRAERTVEYGAFTKGVFLSLLETAILAFGLGLPTAAVVSTLLGVASFVVHPMICAVLFGLFGVFGLALAPVPVVLRYVPRRRPVLRGSLIFLSYAIVLGCAVLFPKGSDRSEAPTFIAADVQTIGAAPKCLLTGYSTVNDKQVRAGTPGTWRYLADTCKRCDGGVAKYGQTGKTFTSIRPVACAAQSPLKSGDPLVFLGASNDDFFWFATGAHSFSSDANIARGLYYLRRPSALRLKQFMNDTAQASRAMMDDQERVLRDTARCASDRGAKLWFFHDFMILDLVDQRSSERLQMLETRRRVVTEGNGGFVDLLEAFGDEAGVCWFNDLIHLSSVGHRHIAERICREISR